MKKRCWWVQPPGNAQDGCASWEPLHTCQGAYRHPFALKAPSPKLLYLLSPLVTPHWCSPSLTFTVCFQTSVPWFCKQVTGLSSWPGSLCTTVVPWLHLLIFARANLHLSPSQLSPSTLLTPQPILWILPFPYSIIPLFSTSNPIPFFSWPNCSPEKDYSHVWPQHWSQPCLSSLKRHRSHSCSPTSMACSWCPAPLPAPIHLTRMSSSSSAVQQCYGPLFFPFFSLSCLSSQTCIPLFLLFFYFFITSGPFNSHPLAFFYSLTPGHSFPVWSLPMLLCKLQLLQGISPDLSSNLCMLKKERTHRRKIKSSFYKVATSDSRSP